VWKPRRQDQAGAGVKSGGRDDFGKAQGGSRKRVKHFWRSVGGGGKDGGPDNLTWGLGTSV